METERLILDSIKESDKEDYFINISHDKKVLETFICRYAETLEDFDFSSYPGRPDLFAVRLKETGRHIEIVNFLTKKRAPARSAMGSGLAIGDTATPPKRFGDFWIICFPKKAFIPSMLPSSQGTTPLAVSWKNAAWHTITSRRKS